jgi:hypothetical protein
LTPATEFESPPALYCYALDDLVKSVDAACITSSYAYAYETDGNATT